MKQLMERRNRGALVEKFKASILASVFVISSLPAYSQDGSGESTDAPIKTLPPLETSSDPVAAQAPQVVEPAGSPNGLTYTPPSADEASESPAAVPEQAGSASPTALEPKADLSSEQPELRPAPATVSPADAPLELPQSSSTETSSGDSTASAGAPTGSSTEAGGATSAAANDAAAEPVATAASDAPATEGTPLSDEPKALAQSGPSPVASPARGVDPAFRKLPSTTGTVKIRRNFQLFASQQLIHNLSFRDTPVREVIAEIARRGNLNIIIDKSVVGKITGDLHDVTLNEAMDSVLASAGLQTRVLDSSTVIVGTPNAMFQLGLNRPMARAFKLSYATPFDVASILFASVFNRGYLPDFSRAIRNRSTSTAKENPVSKSVEQTERMQASAAAGGGTQNTKSQSGTTNTSESSEDSEMGEEVTLTSRPDINRTLRGSTRVQVQEGTGFNAGATDPGSQTIRAFQEVVSDFAVEQNGGGAIVIPDARNRQVIVVGTQEDLAVAEESIRLLDRRPRQVHIQSSLIEITNQGIRQLGASLSLQGEGASGSVLGGSRAPMIAFLPGLGSAGAQAVDRTLTNGIINAQRVVERVAGIPPIPTFFQNTIGTGATQQAFTQTVAGNPLTAVTGVPTNGFQGFVGNALPLSPPSIAGIQAVPQAQTGFNFLSLSKDAGGRANIATLPSALSISLNLVLQTNKAKLLANPSVTVSDNTEALITLANEVVHKVTTTVSLGVVSTNVELVKAGIFLNVLPKTTEDGFITMRLRPQVSSPLGGPQIFANGNVIVTLLNVREIMSQEVRVKDGQTLVIGGLFTEQESATLAKVPYLSEAPILGALFRNSLKGRNRTELMLLITPRVVEEPPPSQVSEGGTLSSPTM